MAVRVASAPLLSGAWTRRENQRLVDALYTQLGKSLDSIPVLTTDAGPARSDDRVVLVAGDN